MFAAVRIGMMCGSRLWDLLSASFYGSVSINSQVTNARGMAFSTDGTKMYVLSGSNYTVYQYTLASPWDVATATYAVKLKSVSSQETNPFDLAFSVDGTKMYVVGTTNKTVYQYTLTTPWDVSTATYASKSKLVSAQSTTPYGLVFSVDGTKMWVLDNTNKAVYQYTLTTAWDISTASYASKNKSVSSQDSSPSSLYMSPDGGSMFIGGSTNGAVYQFALTTAADVSTASYTNKMKSVAAQLPTPRGLAFSAAGNAMYIPYANTVYHYSLG